MEMLEEIERLRLVMLTVCQVVGDSNLAPYNKGPILDILTQMFSLIASRNMVCININTNMSLA
jgi:hypothetical protein